MFPKSIYTQFNPNYTEIGDGMKTKAIITMLTLFLMSILIMPIMAKPEGATMKRELSQLRKATKKYHKVDVALADGYMPVTPHIPGMGAHYVNLNLVLAHSGSFVLEEPEILLYSLAKPKPKLVAVEYAVTSPSAPDGFAGTSDVWDLHTQACHHLDHEHHLPDPSAASPPDCATHAGADPWVWHPDLWGLHVWIHRHNPDGIFEPYNPKIP